MDAADAMEVTESIPAELSTLGVDHANAEQVEPDKTTNDVAMQQLSLEPEEVPLRTPSPTYHESPSTDPGSPLAPEDGVANEEKEKEVEIESSEPSAIENTIPQNAEQSTLDPPNASTALNTTATATTSTTAAEENTDETNIDTEMEEDAPALPEPTETPNNPTTEAPSSDPPSANNAGSPAPTAMEEDPTEEAANPETSANTSMALVKSVPPKVVEDTDTGGSPKAPDVPDKGKGKDAAAVGWGPAEPEKSSLGGAATTDADLSSWGLKDIGTSGWVAGGSGGDANTNMNTNPNPWETNNDNNNNNGNGNGNGNSTANGDSGFGSRGGGWGNRGRDRDSGRDSYGSRDRDRDSYRDQDGLLRRNRPASFGNGPGFGSGFGSGAPPFASGSNTELLPPLGRSPVKTLNSDRHARLARSAPYPPRRETRSGDWGNAGLDYGSAGDTDDWIIRGAAGAGGGGGGGGGVVLSHKPVVLGEMDLGGFDTLSKTMNNADIKAITKSVMDHIGQIQKWHNRNIDAHNLVRQCGHFYTERKAELQASLSVESDPQKKVAIASKLEAHRLKGRTEENLLEATVLSTETGMKREVEALIHTISEAMADKIHACILDVVRSVSASAGRTNGGVGCDVEKVVERCVSIATPKLVKDQLGAQERLIRGLERRVGQLDDSLQERDKTIVDLVGRLKRLEGKGKVVNEAEGGHDLMVTDTDTSPSVPSTAPATTDGGSDSLAAPDAHSQSSISTNCVHH